MNEQFIKHIIMKRLEKKLNVDDFNQEDILSAKEMKNILGGVRLVTSLPHLCQASCHGQAIRKACDEGICVDTGPYANCVSDHIVLFSIGCS